VHGGAIVNDNQSVNDIVSPSVGMRVGMPVSMPVSMAARRARIARLLDEQELASQEAVRAALAGIGIDVTQATVSRDLDAIGAIKRHGADGSVRYEVVTPSVSNLPTIARHEGDALGRVAAETLLDAVPAVNIAVLRTPPGAAHYLAGFIDRASTEGVVGSVAGDDTVIVVMTDAEAAQSFCERLVRLASAGSKERRSS